jgi:hypothetical protein
MTNYGADNRTTVRTLTCPVGLYSGLALTLPLAPTSLHRLAFQVSKCFSKPAAISTPQWASPPTRTSAAGCGAEQPLITSLAGPPGRLGRVKGRSMTPEQNAQYAVAHGLYFDPKTGAMGGNPALQSGLAPQQQGIAALGMSPFGKRMTPAEAAQARAGGAPGPNAIAAQAREGQRGGIMNRVAIRQQNAQQAQDNALAMQQQQMMLGLAQRNPALAMQMAQMNQRGQLAQQQMGLQYAQLGQSGRIAGQNSQDRRYVADRGVDAQNMQAWNQARLALMKEGHSPADVNAYLGPPPATPGSAPGIAGPAPGGLMQQSPVAQGGYKPKRALLDAQVAQVASLPKAKREAALRAMGVTDPGDLHHYQSQLDPKYKEQTGLGALADWLFRPPMDQPGYKSPGIFYRDNPK